MRDINIIQPYIELNDINMLMVAYFISGVSLGFVKLVRW